MKLIYISGFGSTNSSKMRTVQDWAKAEDIEFVNFKYPSTYDPSAIVSKMTEIVSDSDEIIFVGCSLGGFWSLVFGEMFQAPCVVINPSVKPSESLTSYLTDNGKVLSFDKTETYTLTPEIIQDYQDYEVFTNRYPKVAIFNMDDEVINPEIAINTLRNKGKIVTFPDGGHSGKKYIGDAISEIELLINRNII